MYTNIGDVMIVDMQYDMDRSIFIYKGFEIEHETYDNQFGHVNDYSIYHNDVLHFNSLESVIIYINDKILKKPIN